MSGKQDEPPAYAAQSNPQAPQAAYYPPQQGPYGQGPPTGDNSGYYQQNPQMGYGQQPYPPQQGYPPQGYPQQGYYPPQGQYANDRGRSGPGFFEACLAGLACCCCLDLLF